MLARPAAPKSQPARVYGTHGAGACLPASVIMFGAVSEGVVVDGSKIPSVQYANETPVPVVPSGWK